MKKELVDFMKGKNMTIKFDRDNNGDVISYWQGVRSPIVAPFNFIVVGLAKLSPFMSLTRFMFRHILGMKVGKNTGFAQVDIDPLIPELISIGDNSAIGWKSKLLCHGFTEKHVKFGKIEIGKNVLIGAGSFIEPGVKIGDNSVVAMDSLVIKDIPANEMWGGNPAKRIKKLKQLI